MAVRYSETIDLDPAVQAIPLLVAMEQVLNRELPENSLELRLDTAGTGFSSPFLSEVVAEHERLGRPAIQTASAQSTHKKSRLRGRGDDWIDVVAVWRSGLSGSRSGVIQISGGSQREVLGLAAVLRRRVEAGWDRSSPALPAAMPDAAAAPTGWRSHLPDVLTGTVAQVVGTLIASGLLALGAWVVAQSL